MCVVSNVHDHFRPHFDDWWHRTQPRPSIPNVPTIPIVPLDPSALYELIERYRRALEAAKVVDEAMQQPDCVDPEKAALEKRVAELERRIAALESPKQVL
jgi:hypothetical protein